jgi:putative membrane protein
MPNSGESSPDPRTYLAAERSFLAWIRTGIALMGFGFVVARFGLFLHELAASKELTKLPEAGFSMPVGILLIGLGVFVNVIAAVRHHHCVKAIDRGEYRETFGTSFAISIAGIVALIGLAVAIYLAFL